jgi:radical SAM superfamily enzyme YgiQ (UPF0313 family)
MTKVLCVAAGQTRARKVQNTLSRRHLYLNYGLLSLATRLRGMGLDAVQIQGNFDPPAKTLAACIDEGLLESGFPLLLSIPSFYAVPWAREFIAETRKIKPDQRFIVGGRWVVADRPERLSEAIGGVDHVARGLGEAVLPELMERHFGMPSRPASGMHRGARALPPPLDYALLKNRAEYQPSIEVSRGCGMGCSFCQERSEALSPLKSPDDLLSEMRATLQEDGLRPMTPYFEASLFAPNRHWASAFADAVGADPVQWRAEARVDSVLPDVLQVLAGAGLKVIDLGLESADPVQLLRMKKARNPTLYLDRASALLASARASGILAKVNVLLFAGETKDSVERTLDWLERHRDCIAGVSVGPVMCFGWPEDVQDYVSALGEYGAVMTTDQPVHGIGQMHLSPEIDFAHSLEISRQISRSFMTADQYFALKSFSYLPRSYTDADFRRDIEEDADRDHFSFRWQVDA